MLANAINMNMTTALTGQVLQSVKAGDYFLVTENTDEPWTINWECKD
jgi:hypothetical protein